MRVGSHCQPEPTNARRHHAHVADRWYEPVEALLAAMDRAGVERAWLVQLLGVHDHALDRSRTVCSPATRAAIFGGNVEALIG